MKLTKSSAAALSLFLIICVDGMGWGIVFPLFNPILIGNTISIFPADTSIVVRNFWFSIMIAAYSFFMFFGSPILGGLSDQIGRKKILLVSMLGSAIGFLLCVPGIYFASLPLIVLGRIISGLTSGSMAVAQAAMVDISTEKELPARLGLIGAGSAIGFSVGPVLGGFFLDPHLFAHPSYALPFLVCAILFFGVLLFTQLAFKETFIPKDAHKSHFLSGFLHLKQAFVFSHTQHLFLIFSIFLFAHAIFFSSIPLLLTLRFHENPAAVGYFLTYFAVFFSISLLFLVSKIINRFGLKKTIKTALILQMLIYFGFFISHSVALTWLLALPLGITIPCIYIGMINLISNQADKQHQGRMMGVTASVMAITWSIGPMLSCLTVKINYVAPFALSTLLVLCTILYWKKQENR